MLWIVQKFSPVRKKGISRGVWLTGGFLAIIEIIRFIPYAYEVGMSYTELTDVVISIFHSYIVVQVFVDSMVKFIHKWIDVLRNTKKFKDT